MCDVPQLSGEATKCRAEKWVKLTSEWEHPVHFPAAEHTAPSGDVAIECWH